MSDLEKSLNAAIQSPEMQAWLERTAGGRQRLCAAERRTVARQAKQRAKVAAYLARTKQAK
jgi:hypothetical protein